MLYGIDVPVMEKPFSRRNLKYYEMDTLELCDKTQCAQWNMKGFCLSA